ncbi:MAG: protein translocase subunit SecF [Candidatus Kapabacteria bacterium]|nr:protein translocase subunit SecF [Candidatus Kapabacteria bacterium]MCS7169390.1 protein translocase subunit SecF [Candidatus Kapabacteria bacterium]MDW7996446.1 protein translocase subunit SecF [Bacteroidota bacterium]MDW8225734.1 protein translocase subunit SecF [Bacteroidota bacterium]
MEFFGKTNIDFLGKRRLFFFVSLTTTIVGLLTVTMWGLEYGIDFEGGTEIAVEIRPTPDVGDIRAAVSAAGFRGAEIKSYGKPSQFLIRAKESTITETGQDPATAIMSALEKRFEGHTLILIKSDKVGPKIGAEMRFNALVAVIIAVIAILLYIAFRFEFVYGLGATVALVHDVVIAISAIAIVHHLGLLRIEVNQSVLAALLTVLGFSINDTVIIFDRIRENRERYKGMNLIKLMNLSINETLSRTINTVLTTILVLLAILLLGGEVLQGFAFTMLVGIITGTYSSIFIASAFVVWFLQTVRKMDLESEYRRLREAEQQATAQA